MNSLQAGSGMMKVPSKALRTVQINASEITNGKKWFEPDLSASQLPLFTLGQPGSIPALVLPSDDMAAGHLKGATAERFLRLLEQR
ncbi:hypothetical protein T265_08437 [Opisthorchis viverrini]|uniref:Uncharacterized protein n=1 Tax=Opisthorchis viverrini TaxID=6198 RepID=A0A074ZDP9_OPIVI|nr:hypothetical protein T265_08437 [Opisthorchis viverrini]KER23747.1 hypothetical protein T265_08437 [Opisthorchis viverrini]